MLTAPLLAAYAVAGTVSPAHGDAATAVHDRERSVEMIATDDSPVPELTFWTPDQDWPLPGMALAPGACASAYVKITFACFRM